MQENSNHQQSLQSLWAAIADREAHLLALVQASAQIVWVTDASGQALIDPPQSIQHLTWSAFTGMEPEAVKGRGWLKAIHPDDVPVIAAIVEKTKTSDQPFQ